MHPAFIGKLVNSLRKFKSVCAWMQALGHLNMSTCMCHQPSYAFSPLSKQPLRLESPASYSELVNAGASNPKYLTPVVRGCRVGAFAMLRRWGKTGKTDSPEMVWFQCPRRHATRQKKCSISMLTACKKPATECPYLRRGCKKERINKFVQT